MKLHQDFRDLLVEFADAKVEFMVIGGYAVAHYDRPRYTKDIDVWLNRAAPNIERACTALTSFGALPHIIEALRNAREDEVVWLGPLHYALISCKALDKLVLTKHGGGVKWCIWTPLTFQSLALMT